jgi:hypothetical protein
MELLYWGIEQSIKEVLITRKAIENFSSSTSARFVSVEETHGEMRLILARGKLEH